MAAQSASYILQILPTLSSGNHVHEKYPHPLLNSNFCIVKLRVTGVYLFSLFLIQNMGTGQPHYNAIFGVHENRPCYK